VEESVPVPVTVEPVAAGFATWDEEDEPAPDATIVFHRPVDEPVQILPGRLHVISGEAMGEDLRLFSRLGEPPQIVLGREAGPPHRHITLRSPTVSRRHARMEFSNGSWAITNLSETNPVLVNDRVLNNGSSARKLSDGDRIELGEVALRFLAS
jgi:FHA domain-containing protein